MVGKPASSVVRLILLVLAINVTGSDPGNAQTTAPAKRLGILMGGSSCPGPDGPAFWKPFVQKLADRGWIEGRTLIIDCVSAEGHIEHAPTLARQLVMRKPNVLLGAATLTIRALKQATEEIPIVTVASDPLRSGIVSNLARPEANITGLAPMTFDLTAKRIDLLKELLPSLSRLAIVYVVRTAPDPVDDEQMRKDVGKTAQALGISWNVFYPTNENVERDFCANCRRPLRCSVCLEHGVFFCKPGTDRQSGAPAQNAYHLRFGGLRTARASSHLRAGRRRFIRRRSGVR